MHTREKFERDLQQLSDDILGMTGKVEEQLSLALAAYERLDPSLASLVNDLDRQVNKTRFDIEERCLELIAMQQPAARDLRLIIAVLNMIVDIERMGDQAKGIAKVIPHLIKQPLVERPPELKQMGEMVSRMLNQVLLAYARANVDLARLIAHQDDEVDTLYAQVFGKIMVQMAHTNSPERIEATYELLRVARELERFGDLATNIAERIVYLVTGTLEEINVDPEQR